jgi:hypothetical protein
LCGYVCMCNIDMVGFWINFWYNYCFMVRFFEIWCICCVNSI